MTPERRQQLRQLAQAATPGPWHEQGFDKGEQAWFILGGGVPHSASERGVAYTLSYSPHGFEDAAYIDALEADNTRLREALAAMVEDYEESDPFPTSDGHPLYAARAADAGDET